jgi:2-dehydro-3-deoxy-D-pentonate aldolase
MNNGSKHHGVVVPMVTPIAADGGIDQPAVDRLVEFLIAGGVDGVFVLGTTGEGPTVPRATRLQLVEHTVACVRRRALVYAGIGDLPPHDAALGNDYLGVGADALVARPPAAFPAKDLLAWCRSLLDQIHGPMILYNIPPMTSVSIPLDVIGALLGHPRLAGIKDSENNRKRLDELMLRFGGLPNFSVFVGVGALMAHGLKLGADGIVPSVGNLIPDVCRDMCAAAERKDWTEVDRCAARMNTVAGLYQQGRTLGESLAALKAALYCRGLCGLGVLPPLLPLGEADLNPLRNAMASLGLLA